MQRLAGNRAVALVVDRIAADALQRVAIKETPPDETLYNQPGAGGKAGATNYGGDVSYDMARTGDTGVTVTVRIQFNKDGSLSAEPRLMNQGSHPAFQAAAESALRAVRRCAPYTFMPPAKYEGWKDIIVDFDPRDMFRG